MRHHLSHNNKAKSFVDLKLTFYSAQSGWQHYNHCIFSIEVVACRHDVQAMILKYRVVDFLRSRLKYHRSACIDAIQLAKLPPAFQTLCNFLRLKNCSTWKIVQLRCEQKHDF